MKHEYFSITTSGLRFTAKWLFKRFGSEPTHYLLVWIPRTIVISHMSLTETPVGQVDAIKSRFKFGNDAKFEIFVGGKKDIVLTENWLKTQGVGATISDIFVAYYDDKIQKLIAIQAVDPTPILNSTLPDLLSQQTPLH